MLAQRTITAVALAEMRLRAADLSPLAGAGRGVGADWKAGAGRGAGVRRGAGVHRARPGPLAHLRRRAGMGLVTVGLRLARAGDEGPEAPAQRPAA